MAETQVINSPLATTTAQLPENQVPNVNNTPRMAITSEVNLARFLLILAVIGTFGFLGLIVGFADRHIKVKEAIRNKGELPTMETVLHLEIGFLFLGAFLAAIISIWPLWFGNIVDFFAGFLEKFDGKKWYVYMKELLFTLWIFGWLGFAGFIFRSDPELNMSRCISAISLFILCLLTSILIFKKIYYGAEKNCHFYAFVCGYSFFTLLAGFQTSKHDDWLILLLVMSVSVIVFLISFVLKLKELNTPPVEEVPADEVQQFLLESVARLNVQHRLAVREVAERNRELLVARQEIQRLRANSSSRPWLFG